MYQQKYLKYKKLYSDLKQLGYRKNMTGGYDDVSKCTGTAENKNAVAIANTESLKQELEMILGAKTTFADNTFGDGYIFVLVEETDSGDKEKLKQQLFNVARVCIKCNKALGPSLLNCNGCSGDQTGNDTISRNIFSNLAGFLYRLSYSDRPFLKGACHDLVLHDPYFYEQRNSFDVLTYKDALNLSYLHLNAIPMNTWCPDITYLFQDPTKGLELIRLLKQKCIESAKKIIDKYNNVKIDDIPEELIACGFNYPPSENQLHLQFMVLPMRAEQYLKLFKTSSGRGHFTENRFVFFDYLEKALMKCAGDKVLRESLEILKGNSITKKDRELTKPAKDTRASAVACQDYFVEYFRVMTQIVGSSYLDDVSNNVKHIQYVSTLDQLGNVNSPFGKIIGNTRTNIGYSTSTDKQTVTEATQDTPTKGFYNTFPDTGKTTVT